MKKSAVFFLSVLLLSPVFSQNNIFMRSEKAKAGDLRISDLSVDVQIAGNIATTQVDMVFENKSSQILEGELNFPLSQNQYVTGYALDINGKMREGVVVEKEKARVAFEDKVRQNIDPGLVEMTLGNNFKTRVYPLPAKGSRKIQITYEEIISDKYILPTLVDTKLDNFTFNLKILKQSEKDVVLFGNDSGINLGNWNQGQTINFSQKNFQIKNPIVISLPQDYEKTGLVAEDSGRDTFFYYYCPVKEKQIAKKNVKNLGVLWDVSDSASSRDLERELALLKKYLKSKVNDKIEVVLFSNDIVDSKVFSASSEKEIEQFIKSAKYDGATSYEYLNFEKGSISWNEVLLFSDGLVNWGQRKINNSKVSVPLSAISSSISADYNYLKQLARLYNGTYINLLEENDEDAINLLKTQSLRLLKVEYDKNNIQEVYPLPGTEIHGNFSLSGILKKKTGNIKLSFGYGNEVTQEVTVKIENDWKNVIWNESSDKYIARLWAKKKIDELSFEYEKNKSKIIELAKKFRIVTKDTSLIVLETAWDYAKYGITPPDELLKEYQSIAINNSQIKEIQKEGISDSVIRNFKNFKEWWNTKPGEFLKKSKEKGATVFYDVPEVVEREMRFAEPMDDAEVAVNSVATRREVATSRAATNSVMKKADTSSESKSPVINVVPWNPDADYISKLKRVSAEKMYDKYLEIKAEYHDSPTFYMDVADYFWEEDLHFEALRIVSNLAEMNLENTDVLRALGNKLVQWGQSKVSNKNFNRAKLNKLSIEVFKNLTLLKAEIPLFYRDLGLAYARAGEYQLACDSLYQIAIGKWNSKYEEIQQIAINDMNAIIDSHKKAVDTSKYDKRILENFPMDIRVVLTWNTDDCDIDLWVTDPDKEKCYYGHKLTQMGGHNSRDFTQGYGPEEFCLKNAKKGEYKIQADYYGTRSQKILQPVVVQAEVYTNFGKENQSCQILTLQLESVKGNYVVGTIEF